MLYNRVPYVYLSVLHVIILRSLMIYTHTKTYCICICMYYIYLLLLYVYMYYDYIEKTFRWRKKVWNFHLSMKCNNIVRDCILYLFQELFIFFIFQFKSNWVFSIYICIAFILDTVESVTCHISLMCIAYIAKIIKCIECM